MSEEKQESLDYSQVESLLAQALKDPIFQNIVDFIEKDPAFSPEGRRRQLNHHLNISGMVDSQKAYVIAALAAHTGFQPVVLVADELRARSLQKDLQAFISGEILILRQRDVNLADMDASSRESELARAAVLRRILTGDFGGVILTAASLLHRLPPAQSFQALTVSLKIGRQVRPEDLALKLLRMGYERVRQVEGEGEFARRGDVFDVYPPGALPLRISFFDDDIDQIKTFNSEDQRSIGQLTEAEIPPAREIFLPEQTDKLAAKVLQEVEEARLQALHNGADRNVIETLGRLGVFDAERIHEQMIFPGIEKWLPLLLPESQSALAYVRQSKTLLFLDEGATFRKRLDGAQADFAQHFTNLFEKGQVTALAEEAIFKGSEIFKELDQKGSVIALASLGTSGNGLPGGDSFSIKGRASDSFRGHEEKLVELLEQRRSQGLATALLAGTGTRAERLRLFLVERGSFGDISALNLPSGFEYPAAGLLVVGTQDIFGVERPLRKKKRQGMHIDLFSDLVPGELVVHDQHGIGRYDGMVNLESGGNRRDYLKITYAAEDSLYISMENLDQIQKYVGSEGRTPKLSRLGGQEWNRMKEKARGSIRKLAIDLIALYASRQAARGFAFSKDTVWQREFEEDFPYQETDDQLAAIADIKSDMESDKIMDRLLCGDVGFGKTEVAFRAIFKCVMDSRQAILLAPTTVLVQQHFENLKKRTAAFPIKIGLLSRFASQAMIKQTIKGLAEGSIDVVVGTHRVLSKDIRPKDLGLLVVDEEQRFGVEHKERLKTFRHSVDVLTLSATPIPRTLHMSLAGIRDISVLEEPPLDRRPVQTYVMEYEPEMIQEACLREISRQGQVFYLFNDTHRIQEKVAELEKAMPGARIFYAHGKMGERQLETIIEGFVAHEADILVCTTIIESGIDMPTVNTIIVENADRFGLAQLYQLRGRVGRSDRQAYAYITYQKEKILTEVAEKRLVAIRDFTELGSGIKIALKDLEVRGAGNLLGGEQHGQMDVIGYELYCRMLEEEVKTLQGELPQQKENPVVVEMEGDAYIAPRYIPDDGQRMDAYRRLSNIATDKEYMDVLDELLDRFGEIPPQVETLANVSFIRHSAAKMGFQRVTIKPAKVFLYYRENYKPDIQQLSQLLEHPDFKGRILLSAMQKPYLQYNPAPADQRDISGQVKRLLLLLAGEEA